MEEYLIYIGTGLAGLCFLLIIIEHFRLSGLIKNTANSLKDLVRKILM